MKAKKKKKKSIWQQYKKEFDKSRKRSRKETFRLMNVDSRIKKNVYKSLTGKPKQWDRLVGLVFFILVFVIFFIKAKDPDFLEYNVADGK